MEDLKNKFLSIEDVDKEIEEVKQHLKIQEADLAETLKVLPHEALRLAVSPVTETVSSIFGGNFFIKSLGFAKNYLDSSKNKKEEKPSVISNSIKNIALTGLVKIIYHFIRR